MTATPAHHVPDDLGDADVRAALLDAALASGDVAHLGDVLGRLVAARGTATVAAAVGMSEDALRDGLGSVGRLSFAAVSSIIGALDLRLSVAIVYSDPDDVPDTSTPMWTTKFGLGPFRREIGQPTPPDDEQ